MRSFSLSLSLAVFAWLLLLPLLCLRIYKCTFDRVFFPLHSPAVYSVNNISVFKFLLYRLPITQLSFGSSLYFILSIFFFLFAPPHQINSNWMRIFYYTGVSYVYRGHFIDGNENNSEISHQTFPLPYPPRY